MPLPPSVFVSDASADRAIATEVCALLAARRVSCWIAPRDVTPGAKWDDTLLLSSASNDSPFV